MARLILSLLLLVSIPARAQDLVAQDYGSGAPQVNVRPAAVAGGGVTIVQTCEDKEADNVSSCNFASDVTSGNRIMCLVVSAAANAESTPTANGNLSTWVDECDASVSELCSTEIISASVTTTAAVDPAYGFVGGGTAYTSIYCVEVSGASDIVGLAADTDTDDPQAELISLTSGAWMYGSVCDWDATTDVTIAYTTSPALTEVLFHHDPANYTVGHYRSTSTIASTASYTVGTTDAAWAGTNVAQCFVQLLP